MSNLKQADKHKVSHFLKPAHACLVSPFQFPTDVQGKVTVALGTSEKSCLS